MTATEFKEALKKVYEKDLDKIIAQKYRDWTKSKRYLAQEKKRAKRDKEFLDHVARTCEIDRASFIGLLNEIKSAEVLKSIICYMLSEKKGDEKK